MKDIKFVNHACFSFTVNNFGVLVDPWFAGAIFNQSWRLVSDGGKVPENLKYIFITHEHPDHLHWPTLKKLASQNITVCLAKRQNPNVVDNLKRMGYKVLELDNQRYNLDGLFVEFFGVGHDNAIVFQSDGLTVLNQNDCYLSDSQAFAIKAKYPVIDLWWMQFSLAGYYGNFDDVDAMNKAQQQHKDWFSTYKAIFDPKISIPFASYVYFSRKENQELNRYRVRLEDLLEDNTDTQVLFKGDTVLFEDYDDRNQLNVTKWEELFESTSTFDTPSTSLGTLQENFVNFCNKYQPQGSLEFELSDKTQDCILDFTTKRVTLGGVSNPIAKVAAFDLSEMFKNPWGADTMNITSCFHVYNLETWRSLLGTIDSLYTR